MERKNQVVSAKKDAQGVLQDRLEITLDLGELCWGALG